LDNLSPKEALDEFKEAIALDPGDSWSYAFTAFTLTSLNRSAEAIAFINTAMRLDPRPPPLFHYYLGMAYFNMERFDDAALALERATTLNPDDEFSFLALGATYGHLGRKQDAKAAIERYNAIEVSQGGVPATVKSYSDYYFLEGSAPYQRLSAGLRLAGAPEYLSNSEFADRNRHSAAEIHSLFFGHRLHGRMLRSGEEREATVTTEGVVTMSGDWILGGLQLADGTAHFRGNELCIRFGVAMYCGSVFRNPGGTRQKENEYIWHSGGAFTFSQME
jgi:tetratricopeptide (TPR) repeat protein